ncbi:MAG TPA: Ig-like domain-containing protein [Solirubrobacter sp.]
MARSVRVASCFFLVGLVLLLPSQAAALPPTCISATLYTPVNTRLVLGAAGNPCSDPEGDPYTVALTSEPTHGTLAPDGSYYDPDPGFHNVDVFSYQATVSPTEKSAIATITIIVDSAPVCSDGSATTSFNHAVTIAEFPCSDVDDPTTFTVIVDDGAHGTVTVDGTTGEVSYLPAPGFVGTDSFPFWAEDDFGQASPKRSMTVTVTNPPAATPLPTATVLPAPPPPAPPDRTAPVVTLKNASVKQAVSIVVTTSENASATLTLSLDKALARKLKVGRTVGTLKTALTAGNATLSIRLTAKARKVLKRVRRAKLTLTAVVTDAAGNTTTKTLVLTLKK